jgi:hypothetical protein
VNIRSAVLELSPADRPTNRAELLHVFCNFSLRAPQKRKTVSSRDPFGYTFHNSVRTSQQTHYVSATETNRLMLFGERNLLYPLGMRIIGSQRRFGRWEANQWVLETVWTFGSKSVGPRDGLDIWKQIIGSQRRFGRLEANNWVPETVWTLGSKSVGPTDGLDVGKQIIGSQRRFGRWEANNWVPETVWTLGSKSVGPRDGLDIGKQIIGSVGPFGPWEAKIS